MDIKTIDQVGIHHIKKTAGPQQRGVWPVSKQEQGHTNKRGSEDRQVYKVLGFALNLPLPAFRLIKVRHKKTYKACQANQHGGDKRQGQYAIPMLMLYLYHPVNKYTCTYTGHV